MGSTIVTASDAIVKHLFLSIYQIEPQLPDYTTLPLLIHKTIMNNDMEDFLPSWEETTSLAPTYIFAKKLASIFKKFFTFSQIPSGEAIRYQKLFSHLEGTFSSYKEIFSQILLGLQTCSLNQSLHIFGCSHLPKHIASFFVDLGKYFPVHFYCLSPCKEYFGDLLSDKAIDFFWRTLPKHSNTTSWEHYVLADRQTLLANLAYKSLTSQNFFLDRDVDSIEKFLPSKKETSLDKIKNALLNLEAISSEDLLQVQQTITISQTPSPVREVQETFLKVSSLLDRGVIPEDIFILSTHIETYEVFLKAIFQPHIPIYFTEVLSPNTELLKEKLLLLSSLVQTQGSLHYLLQLLTHPSIQNPIESNKVPHLVKKLSNIWSHLSSKEEEKPFDILGNYILADYPFQEDSGKISYSDIWETVLPLIYQIQDFINLYTNTKTHSYETHFENIFVFLETIFTLSSEELSLITSLKNIIFPKYASTACSFLFFIDFCLDYFSRSLSNNPFYDKPGPFIGRLTDLSIIPKGYTFILGANKTPQSSDLIELLKATTHEELAFSSTEDEENLHFLQIIVSTREELHISYLSSPQHSILPSPFLNHIKDALKLPETTLTTKSYIPKTFHQSTRRHFSQVHHYNLAKAFCEHKHISPSLFEELPQKIPTLPQNISLSQLVNGILSPLELFLKTNYNLVIRPPKALGVHPKLSPTKYHITRFWEDCCLKESTLIRSISPFSESLFSCYRQQMHLWFDRIEDPIFIPYSVILSSAFFQELPSNSLLFSPVPLSLERGNIFIHGTISGVFSKGLYLCAIDPSETVKKNSSKNFPETTFELKSLLERYIALALLQNSNLLPKEAHIRKLTSFDSYNTLPLPFDNPQEYLLRVIEIYQMMCSSPIPLLSPICWKYLDNPEKLRQAILNSIKEDANNPSSTIFWNFHNRRIPEKLLEIDKQQCLKIQSLFKGSCAIF